MSNHTVPATAGGMPLTRRALMRSGTTLVTVGAAGMIASQCIPVEAPAAATEIQALFARWTAIRDRDWTADAGDALASNHAAYAALQERITAAEPTTARDLAIQIYVETDAGDSDMRETFFRGLAAMAVGQKVAEARQGIASDPFVTRMERFQRESEVFNATPGNAAYEDLPDYSLCNDLRSGAVKIDSVAGAALAVRYVVDDDCIGDTTAEQVLASALAFLEGRV